MFKHECIYLVNLWRKCCSAAPPADEDYMMMMMVLIMMILMMIKKLFVAHSFRTYQRRRCFPYKNTAFLHVTASTADMRTVTTNVIPRQGREGMLNVCLIFLYAVFRWGDSNKKTSEKHCSVVFFSHISTILVQLVMCIFVWEAENGWLGISLWLHLL